MNSIRKKISKEELLVAAQELQLDSTKMERLWEILNNSKSQRNSRLLISVLYFFGALLAAFALWLAVGQYYKSFGVGALAMITLTFAWGFYGAGFYLWKDKRYELIGGLCIFTALSLIPLIAYTFQDWGGWWRERPSGFFSHFYPWFKHGWFAMEMSTIITTLITLRYIRFPLLTAILYVALGCLAIDVAPLFLGNNQSDIQKWHAQTASGILLGLSLTVFAYRLDRKRFSAFAFWAYLYGVGALWTAVTLIEVKDWLENMLYGCFNLLLIFLFPVLRRRVLLVFGTVGLLIYLCELTIHRFADSKAFIFILCGIGIAVIALGVIAHRYFSKRQTSHLKRS